MKSFIKISLIYIFIFELIFQSLIFLNLKYVTIPDLYYNGYCDQKYWNFNPRPITFKNKTKYHPLLSYIKNDLDIPNSEIKNTIIEKKLFNNNDISFYGSSYINHEDFKSLISQNDNFNYKNYALNSYGLDQIFLSYKLTAHMNQNRTIVIGFLLEDLDRSIFTKRDYEKVKFELENDKFVMTNTPIDTNKKEGFKTDFYLFKFLTNFYNLIRNDFDPRHNNCKKKYKSELLEFYLKEFDKLSKTYNQKLIFITFNLEEDLTKNPTWRYDLVTNFFKKMNFVHIDSYKILKNISSNNDEIKSYFGSDKHNNKKSFKYIVDELFLSL